MEEDETIIKDTRTAVQGFRQVISDYKASRKVSSQEPKTFKPKLKSSSSHC